MLRALPPLYHRMTVGRLSVTQLCDGVVEHAPAQEFFGVNADPKDFLSLSQSNDVSIENFEFPATVTYVESGKDRVLIDAGHGHKQRPHAGLLREAMHQADIDPDRINHVLITHLHGDHIGGLVTPSGDPTFRNARHWVSPLETAYWLGPASNQAIASQARTLVEVLGPQLSFISPGDELVDGVSIIDGAGHTPGHLCVMLKSLGERLFVAADVANHPVWAFMKPRWAMKLDVNPERAAEMRVDILSQLADEAIPLAGYHMGFPAIGTVRRNPDMEESFLYTPADA